MNQQKVTNRELLEAVNKNTDKLDGEVSIKEVRKHRKRGKRNG